MRLDVISGSFSILKLPAGQPMPVWASDSEFLSLTRTLEELSLVVDSNSVPEGEPLKVDAGWRGFRVAGTLDFSLTGVLSSIAAPLAKKKVSIFAISTFDTDYVLVKEDKMEEALRALSESGFIIKDKA